MTFERSPLFAVTFLAFTVLAANACGGSNSGDDDSSMSGKGAVLSGGTSNNGGTTSSGGTAQGATGGTADMGGSGGTSASAGRGGNMGTAGAGDTSSSGSSGTGGSAPAGGKGGTSSGTGGATGGSGGTSTSGGDPLGSSCRADADCASGLTCITADSQTLGGAPPGGLCTLKCSADADCTAFADGAYCVAFDADQKITYCLEGCTTGQAGAPKCNERPDFACNLLGLIDGTKSCTSTDDCGSRQLCDTDTNVCADTVTGCLPACRGDFDCASGQYCDFLSGMCMSGKATGLAIGSACDPKATQDPCNGFCSAVDDAATIGACAGFCSLTSDATGCGWSGTGTASAGCLFATPLSPPMDLALGDLGICGALCDCNDDCTVETERCVDDVQGATQKIWGRAGYCRPLLSTETESDSLACK